jgi:hypothetical protein
VLTLADDAIRPTPEFASATFDTKYITGLGTVDDQMIILLDIEKLMTGADMALVDGAGPLTAGGDQMLTRADQRRHRARDRAKSTVPRSDSSAARRSVPG